MTDSIYKACDIRGEFGREVTPEHAVRLAHALVLLENPAQVIVAGDGRLSTPVLKEALIDTLVSLGVRVIDLGAVPTPVFYFARRRLGIRCGVVVTASHNPASYNGFKITLGDLPVRPSDMVRIRYAMQSGKVAARGSNGSAVSLSLTEEYLDCLAEHAADGNGISLVVDCGNGMWGPRAPGFLRALGYSVTELYSDVDGRFPNHAPNPADPANLSALCREVVNCRAALGIALDGDGDRVAFVDERGRPVENDCIIVLFAQAALEKRPGAAIVYDQKCSGVVREEILRHGGVPSVAKSGHTFLKTAFKEMSAAYAGELSGHHFFPEIGGDDGLVAALHMAELIQQTNQHLSRLTARIPHYPNTPDIRIPIKDGECELIIHMLGSRLHGAQISRGDGVRADFPDGWGLARISVTEPVMTLRFEAQTEAALERIKREFVSAAPQLDGKI